MSSQDTTVPEFIVNELTEEKLKELEDTSQIPANQLFFTNSTEGECYNGLPLGTILPMAIEIDSIYLKKLDGTCINIHGIYKTFCDLIINSYTNNPSSVPVCDIGEYATEVETYGQCGKFVINKTGTTLYSGNYSVEGNSIKLPTITEFIASNNGGDSIGLAELDEFKSHTHIQEPHSHSLSALFGWGAGTWNAGPRTDSNDPANAWLNINSTTAINKNSGGEETRPKNIRYPYYIVVLSSQLGETLLKDLILQNSKAVKLLYEKGRIDLPISSATGGIAGTNSITLPDNMDDYKTLIIYCTFANVPHMYTIDLTTKNTCGYLTNYPYAGGGTLTGLDDIMAGSSTTGIFFSFIGINEGKTNLTHIHTGFTSGETVTFRDTNTGYIIYKIEGVLTDEAIKSNLNTTTNIIDLDNTERVETIYDMNSNNTDINLGYTGGIPSLTTINFGSTQLSKYKRLICTYILNFTTTVFEVDLTIKHQGDRYDGGGFGIIVNDSGIGSIVKYGLASVSADKASLTVHAAFYRLDTSTDYNDRAGYFCAKIEGVY